MSPLSVEARSSIAGGRPAKVQYQQQPDMERDDREAIAMAIGKVLRLARHAAELNMTQTPADVEQSLRDLQAAVDAAVRRCSGRL